jgi:hypothetical protein
MTEWRDDPTLDWPKRFAEGDIVRLTTGEIGIVDYINNVSADQTKPKYDLIVTYAHRGGYLDTTVILPWLCSPANDSASRDEAAEAGLLYGR